MNPCSTCGQAVSYNSDFMLIVAGEKSSLFCGEACFLEHIEEIVVSKSRERRPTADKCKSCGCECDLDEKGIKYLITSESEDIFCSSSCLKEHVNRDMPTIM